MGYVRAATVSLSMALALTTPFSVRAEQFDLKAYAGKVVYLDFWASWCAPCRQSFPWLNEIQTVYGRRGVIVIAVNVDKEPALAQKFLQAHPANFQIAFDPKGAIADGYDIQAMPTSMVIGRDGRIRAIHQGFHPEEERDYVAHIEAALREGAGTEAQH